MPRTIESILSCHRAAEERRNQGKPIWERTIDVKSILKDHGGTGGVQGVVDKAHRIAKLLRSQLPAELIDGSSDKCDSELEDVVVALEEFKADMFAASNSADLDAIDEFDGWLDMLYDRFDVHRIWSGI